MLKKLGKKDLIKNRKVNQAIAICRKMAERKQITQEDYLTVKDTLIKYLKII